MENTKKDLVSISDDLEESKSILDTLKIDYDIQNNNLESAKLMQQANLVMVEKDNAQLQELENLKQHEAAQLAEEIRLMVMTSNYQGSYTGGRLGLLVVNVRITSPFGYRIHPLIEHGAEINNIVSRLDSDDIAYNLDTIIEHGAEIDNVVNGLSPYDIINNFNTLIKHGADIDVNELVSR